MSLTPVEIRHVKLGRGVGYKREPVDRLLGDIVESFERVWRDRADLADKLEAYDHDLSRYREMETILRTTLVSAESAASDMRERARHEAQVIVDEARSEARSILREAERERSSLLQEARRIRALLGAALTSIVEATGATATEAQAAATATAGAPPTETPTGSHAAVTHRQPLLEDTAEHALSLDEPAASGFRAA